MPNYRTMNAIKWVGAHGNLTGD